MSWYATKHRSYVPPLVKGMRRTNEDEKERDRMLDDNEIRLVWDVAGQSRTYGALIRMLLLTAQRFDKVRTMRWSDLDDDGTWTVRTSAREKGNIGKVKLPELARSILASLPRFANNEFIFAGQGQQPISASGLFKAKVDDKLPPDTEPWRLHDLRRTARSLMSRAKVSRDDAERVMGHSLGNNIEGIYDRHAYFDEKSEALAKLADLIDGIVNPRVVPMARKG
jgi:integrase